MNPTAAETPLADDGRATLDQELFSQGIRFPAGSMVESELEIPIFRKITTKKV